MSFFAVQAGASKVYAVEGLFIWLIQASSMSERISKLLSHTKQTNKWMDNKIIVLNDKIEHSLQIPQVDTIISEPIGVLLVQ